MLVGSGSKQPSITGSPEQALFLEQHWKGGAGLGGGGRKVGAWQSPGRDSPHFANSRQTKVQLQLTFTSSCHTPRHNVGALSQLPMHNANFQLPTSYSFPPTQWSSNAVTSPSCCRRIRSQQQQKTTRRPRRSRPPPLPPDDLQQRRGGGGREEEKLNSQTQRRRPPIPQRPQQR